MANTPIMTMSLRLPPSQSIAIDPVLTSPLMAPNCEGFDQTVMKRKQQDHSRLPLEHVVGQ